MNRLLELRAVSKRYLDGDRERWVLRDFDLTIESGASLAVSGPSGSGKTTLLNLLAATHLPDSGDVVFSGGQGSPLLLNRQSERIRSRYRCRHVGYVFQFFNLIPTLTVAENLRVPLELTGQRHLRDEAMARLAALGLADRGAAFPAQLSGGEQQRVAIARALAHRPALVLADEPTGNLDADNADRVAQLLWRETAAIGATLVVATHSERIAALAGRHIRLV